MKMFLFRDQYLHYAEEHFDVEVTAKVRRRSDLERTFTPGIFTPDILICACSTTTYFDTFEKAKQHYIQVLIAS